MLARTSRSGISSMKTWFGLTLVGAVGVFASGALAGPVVLPDSAAHTAAVGARQAKIAQMTNATKLAQQAKNAQAQATASSAKAMGADTSPGSPTPNPVRAYPPSCAASPLPNAASGPSDRVYSTRMQLYTRDPAGNVANPETVTVTLWRIACSSGGSVTPYNSTGNYYNAMTLFRVDRDSGNEGVTDAFPTFPSLTLGQGNNLSNPTVPVRTAMEPNTILEDKYDTPIVFSQTYVLENYYFLDQSGNTDLTYNSQFSDAFTLLVDPIFTNTGQGAVQFQVGGYAPDSNSYPAAFQPLPIDGYMSTSWYSPDHGGEGMTVQVYDNGPSDTGNRTFAAGWYASDATGRPFWLLAQGTMPVGATSVQTTAYYTNGGGFAGSAGNATVNTWGTVTFTFQDCNHMHFTYNGQTDATTAGPSGSGSRDWIRVANENGLACE